MELPKPDIHTSTMGHLKEESFGLCEENMGMIFDILRNKMYSNPIAAICREVACNSRDAHKEVGKEKIPIQIHLPSLFEPTIKFQDFGPGISPQRMSDVFLKYAASTKRVDNKQIGGFGIGAKTPFAYTDSFTVVTVVDGVERHYHAYIDETQVGKMALARETKVTAPNGTTIIIPVDKYDCIKFCRQVIMATQYWELKPILHGGEQDRYNKWEYIKTEKLFKGDDWYLADGGKCTALVGEIAYRIEGGNLLNASQLVLDAANHSLFLTFDIGQVSLIASRERIHYDEKTQKLLCDRLEEAAKSFLGIAKDSIDNAKDYCEARRVLSSYLGVINRNAKELKKELRALTWKGHELLETIKVTDIGETAFVKTYVKTADGVIKAQVRRSQPDGVLYVDNALIYHNDRDIKTVSRRYAEKIFKENPAITKVQIILTPEKDLKDKKIKYNNKLLKLIGTRKLSTVTPDKISKESRATSNRFKKGFKENITAYELYGWNDINYHLKEVSNADGGIYIVVNREYGSKRAMYRSTLPNLYSRFHIYTEFIGETIYGFTPTRVKKLGPKWKKLEVVVEEKIVELEKKIDLKAIKKAFNGSNFLWHYHVDCVEMDTYAKMIVNSDSICKKYYNESVALKAVIDKYSKYINLLIKLGRIKDNDLQVATSTYSIRTTVKDETGLKGLWKLFKERYPMLKLIRHTRGKDQQIVINYINKMDAAAKASDIANKIAKSA